LPGGARFCLHCGQAVAAGTAATARSPAPETYTPKHLAEKILTSKAALEGERKQVTVLFSDLKGSMELLADRDPEEARKLLDPVLERMMEAVHRYEGTVNQMMGDGIMALFGAPVAHEDHAVRACYAALRMQELVKGYAEQAFRAHGVTLRIRVGLNSGEVELDGENAGVQLAAPDVGETRQHAEHRPVVGQDVGREPAQAARRGRGEERVEQDAAEPPDLATGLRRRWRSQ
jgi:class 3 adenylate cyclase